MKESHMKKTVLITAAVLFSAFTAVAQPAMPEISPEEMQEKLISAVKAEFDNIDTDGDGIISHDEFIEYQIAEIRKKGEENFRNIDADGSNDITEEEYFTALKSVMDQLAEKMSRLAAD